MILFASFSIEIIIPFQPKKSPVKEAKKETVVKKAPVSEANKNVKKAAASPAGKKTKDPNAPKMPTTAYMQFNKEQRLKLTDAGQKVNIIGEKTFNFRKITNFLN